MSSPASATIGFVGLGNMGAGLATNLVQAGHAVVCTDVVGPERSPDGADFVDALAQVAQRAEVIVLSLPEGRVSEMVARSIQSADDRRTTHVVDTSTVGVGASQAIANAASGQSAATTDKFPNHVLTGRYASGFSNGLMTKDVLLYLGAVEERAGPSSIGSVTASGCEQFAAGEPGADFTRIYLLVESSGGGAEMCFSLQEIFAIFCVQRPD